MMMMMMTSPRVHNYNCSSKPRLLSTLLLLSQMIWIAHSQSQTKSQSKKQHHERLFPRNDDYDPAVLDATNLNGSPYGGFSRATRSRLAALPLKLPDQIVWEDDADTDKGDDSTTTTATQSQIDFWEIGDGLGRRYVCRYYDEYELSSSSLLRDSLFDPPQFRFTSEVDDDKHQDIGERVARVVANDPELLLLLLKEDDKDDTPSQGSDPQPNMWSPPQQQQQHQFDNDIDGATKDESRMDKDVDRTIDREEEEEDGSPFELLEIERRLDSLEGVCLQKRIKHWTYEWCWEGKVQRFHMKVLSSDPQHPRIQLEDVTNLGYYHSRKLKQTPNDRIPPAEDDVDYELGQARETFRHGAKIPGDMDSSRKTDVYLRCCFESTTQQYQTEGGSTTLLDGEPLPDIALAAITNVWMDPNEVGKYHMDICTPLLCEETDTYQLDEILSSYQQQQRQPTSSTARSSTTAIQSNPKQYEHMSVADILDKTLGDSCLYSKQDGWWFYEYCHRQYVRQFSGTAKYTGIDLQDDTQYLLGFFTTKESDHLASSKSKEWEHVVNATDDLGQITQGSSKRGGNGAYFEVEFLDGEMCIDEDGNSSVERACSVRFSCAEDYTLTVREDSTCHYVAEVTMPALCQHPLFKPLVTKKRAAKCLLVEDEKDHDII